MTVPVCRFGNHECRPVGEQCPASDDPGEAIPRFDCEPAPVAEQWRVPQTATTGVNALFGAMPDMPDPDAPPAEPPASSAGERYRKRPVVIEAHQWFRNGDHPADYAESEHGLENGELREFSGDERKRRGWEGSVVRYFRRPEPEYGDDVECPECGVRLHEHGFIDTLEGGHRVCPGDFIITGVKGERYPCKPDIFALTYEPATTQPPAPFATHPGGTAGRLHDVFGDLPAPHCAHSRVRRVPLNHDDGTVSDRWLCDDCLREFAPLSAAAKVDEPDFAAWARSICSWAFSGDPPELGAHPPTCPCCAHVATNLRAAWRHEKP